MVRNISRLPIWQAPVGSIAGSALALTWTAPEDARNVVASLVAKAEGVFQGNFVLAFPLTCLPPALEQGYALSRFRGESRLWKRYASFALLGPTWGFKSLIATVRVARWTWARIS